MVNMQDPVNSEEKIKIAAEKIFLEKGYSGARMQDIADSAGVNKAMLNYYFRSKKALFDLIFIEKFAMLFGNLASIMMKDIPFEEKICQFVETEISILSDLPQLPMFVVNELQKDPELLQSKLKDLPIQMMLDAVRSQFQKEIKEGRFREVAFEQFMVNMISMCIFPIMAQHLLKFILGFDENQYQRFINDRKKIVSDFLLNYMIAK